jgi:hypothetical protein
MMLRLPTVLLLGAGPRCRIWIPVPVILLWPFWLLGWMVWAPARLLHPERAHALRAGLILVAQLSGLKVDLKTTDGTRIRLRFV